MAERPYIVGMAGASGAIIGIRLIEELIAAGKNVHACQSCGRLVYHPENFEASQSAETAAADET